MNGVSVSLDGRKDNSSIFVRQLIGSSDRYAAIGDGVLVNGSRVLHSECDVFDSITMLNQVFVHLLRGIAVVHRAEDKSGSFMIPDHVAGNGPISGFKSLIGQILEAEPGSIVRGSLFGVAYPEGNMV